MKLYPQFDHVVLLSAPPSVIVDRLARRMSNTYGKRSEEAARVDHLQAVEPALRRAATEEVDTTAPLDEVVTTVLAVVGSRE